MFREWFRRLERARDHIRFSKKTPTLDMCDEIKKCGRIWSSVSGGESGRINTMWLHIGQMDEVTIKMAPNAEGDRVPVKSVEIVAYRIDQNNDISGRILYFGGSAPLTLKLGHTFEADETILKVQWDGAPSFGVSSAARAPVQTKSIPPMKDETYR